MEEPKPYTRNKARDENMLRVNHLALKVAAGDEEAFAELALLKESQIRHMAHEMQSKFGSTRIDEEDLYQIGLIKLWERALEYPKNKENQVSFWSQTQSMIYSAMRMTIGATIAEVNIPMHAFNVIWKMLPLYDDPVFQSFSWTEKVERLSVTAGINKWRTMEMMSVIGRFFRSNKEDFNKSPPRGETIMRFIYDNSHESLSDSNYYEYITSIPYYRNDLLSV